MKKLIVLAILLTSLDIHAQNSNPISGVKQSLEGLLKPLNGRKTFFEMRKIANEKNTDIDLAFENYIIAKKNVNIARSQFNPITSGHLLGISMGLNYFWAPMAIEAILSIPTKIYNIQKNKYLAKAALYNLHQARDVLGNELAHLYYDILTHEVLLKTIDQEVDILSYQENRWRNKKYPEARIRDLQKWILNLNKEKIDIYNMYNSELAALRTLVSTDDPTNYELAQVDAFLSKDISDNLNLDELQNFALLCNDKYKAVINLHRASISNVKSVKWSILTWSGLNLSYGRKVKEAKNEEDIAELRKEAVEEEVKTNLLMQHHKLNSSVQIFSNFNEISNESLQVYADAYQASQIGQMTEDALIETAIVAVRDFRNKVISHYIAWSSFDDFSTSANFDFSSRPDAALQKNIQTQIEENPLYSIKAEDFSIVKKNGVDSFTLSLSTLKKESVFEVDYLFSNAGLPNRSNDNGVSNFAVTLRSENLPQLISGVAIVTLMNGHQFNIKFKL